MSELRPQALSWTALLGRWIDYARASLAIPDDHEGARWKRSVEAVITMQAVTFALHEITELDEPDRALAIDRAQVLLDDAQTRLDAIWRGVQQSDALREIIDGAHAALHDAQLVVGGWELTWSGAEPMIMPFIEMPDSAQTLLVMMPGSIVMPHEPVVWGRQCEPPDVAGCELRSSDGPRQVYRRLDDNGAITGDLVAPLADDLPPGMPLLVPWFADGQRLGHFTMEADQWLATQRRGLDGAESINVEFACSDPD